MRINGFRCDVCCKEHLLNKDLVFTGNTPELLPKGWLIVWQCGEQPKNQDSILFCSVACLAQWAEKQVIVAREAKPALGGLVTKDWIVNEAAPSSTEVFEGLAERLQQLGEVPRKRLPYGTWLPGDEE